MKEFSLYVKYIAALPQGLGRPGQGGQLTPKKLALKVRNCIWRLFLCCVSAIAISICISVSSPYIALTIGTILRGGTRIDESCYMRGLKIDFSP